MDKKIIRQTAAKVNAAFVNKIISKEVEVRQLIVPTIINASIIAEESDAVTKVYDTLTLSEDKYLYKDFVMVKYYLIESLANCIPSAQRLFKVIYRNIQATSNVVQFTYDECKRANVGKYNRQIDQAITDLVNHQVIFYTNVKSMYVINHNMYFKGNWDKFCRMYKDRYGDIPPESYYNADEKRLYIKDYMDSAIGLLPRRR